MFVLLQNLVHVPAVLFLNHGTKFSFVPEDEDQWFCFCQENNFIPLMLSGCFMYRQKVLLSAHAVCVCVFCRVLITNSDYFTVQHKLIGFYYRDGVCFLRGTD